MAFDDWLVVEHALGVVCVGGCGVWCGCVLCAHTDGPEEVNVYVIVETDNRYSGGDAVMSVLGPFDTEEDALDVNAMLRAHLPAEYKTHEENPIDYTVMNVWRPR